MIVGREAVDRNKYPYMAYISNYGAILVRKNIFLTEEYYKTLLCVILNKGYLLLSARSQKLPESCK